MGNVSYRQLARYPYDAIKDSGLFDKGIADCSNISLLSCSHIHSNSMLAFYHERYYELNSASGFGAERNEDVEPLVTEIKIDLSAETVKHLCKITQY